MPLEYIVLFEELLEITKKIAFNTTSQEMKQQLVYINKSIVEDITDVLNLSLKSGLYMTQKRKLKIQSNFQVHQKRLNAIIEQFGFRKICTKCGKELAATTRFYYRDCTAKDGLRNDCKQCHKATKKESYYQKKKCSTDATLIEEEDLIREEYENIILD